MKVVSKLHDAPTKLEVIAYKINDFIMSILEELPLNVIIVSRPTNGYNNKLMVLEESISLLFYIYRLCNRFSCYDVVTQASDGDL